MDDLKGSIGLNAYAQRNPISEYRIQSADMFDMMNSEIKEDTVRMILSVEPSREIKRVEVAKVKNEGFVGSGEPVKIKAGVHKKNEKVGRNDPCPCGSGKKYKKCCGRNEGDDE